MEISSSQGGVLIAALLIAFFVVWVLAKRLRAATAFLAQHLWAAALVEFLVLPAAILGMGRSLEFALSAIGLEGWPAAVHEATNLLICLAIGAGSARFAELWILSKTSETQDKRLPQLIRGVLYGFCLVLGLVFFLVANGYTSNSLLYSTGVGAALIVFALQHTLGDLFSGIALSAEQPFRIGEWIRLSDGTEGQVTDVTWRATRLKCWDGTTRVVPNSLLAREPFTNLHGSKHLFAPWYYVRISGDADPKQVKLLLETAAKRCDTLLRDPPPVVRLVDGSTIPYTYMVWVHFPNYPAMFSGREELYREIHYALREAGLETAADIHDVRYRPTLGAPAETIFKTGTSSGALPESEL